MPGGGQRNAGDGRRGAYHGARITGRGLKKSDSGIGAKNGGKPPKIQKSRNAATGSSCAGKGHVFHKQYSKK